MLEDKTPKRTELNELGEYGLADYLSKAVKTKHKSTLTAFGEDAVILKNESDNSLISSNVLIENIHFDLTYVPLKHLGYKAVVISLSDLAAMNVKAQQISIDLAFSNRFSLEAVEELFAGIRLACERYNVDIVGIKTGSSQQGLTIFTTVFGQADSAKIVYRNQAKENDLLCVSGDLGAAYAGLLLLEREKAEYLVNPAMQPDLQGHEYVLERQLKPEVRFDVLDIFEQKQIKPTAMILLSKGLAGGIIQLSNASGLGCMLYETKIPIDPGTSSVAEVFKIQPTITALNGGDDYELLFSISQQDYDKIEKSQDITVIGHMTESAAGCMLVPENGPLIPLKAQGFQQ